MSKLDELIKKYCPAGISYKAFGESATIARGASPRPIKKFITTDSNGINWIKIGDVKPGAKYITECAEKITIEGSNKSRFVKKGDFILSNSMSFGRPYILSIDGCIHDGWLAISNFDKSYITDFLYHLLNSNNCQSELKKRASFGGAVQNLNADIVRSLVLPVPPLPVQEEIVRILDSFILLTAELQDKLNTELQARKKQYEYYKHHLLHRSDKVVELASVAYYVKERINANMVDKTTYVGVDNLLQNCEGKVISNHVPTDGKLIKYMPNDILIGNIRPYLRKIWFADNIGGTNGDVLTIRLNDNSGTEPKYLYHVLSSDDFFIYDTNNAKGAKMPRGNKDAVMKYKFSVPTLLEQRKIADILEHFYAICNDITTGLPAEIAARQKQYEYYRDKLLTFKELS